MYSPTPSPAADSTDHLDVLFRAPESEDLDAKLAQLGPRGRWRDGKGRAWTLSEYASHRYLDMKCPAHVWKAIVRHVTQCIPNTEAGRRGWRNDLVWLWVGEKFNPLWSNASAVEEAIGHPDHGWDRAGWGIPGEGWIAHALACLRGFCRTQVASDASDWPTLRTSCLKLSLQVLRGVTTTIVCQKQPQALVPLADLDFPFMLRSSQDPSQILAPLELKESFGTLFLQCLATELEIDGTMASHTKPNEARIKNWNEKCPEELLEALTIQEAERAAVMIFDHMAVYPTTIHAKGQKHHLEGLGMGLLMANPEGALTSNALVGEWLDELADGRREIPDDPAFHHAVGVYRALKQSQSMDAHWPQGSPSMRKPRM